MPDDEAEIVFLKNMKGGNVIRSIAASEHDDLKTFGQRLLDWESIKLIEKKYGKQDAAIVAEAILETWIGRGEDTTYRRLIDCLKKTNMGGIARRIEAQATSADKRAQRTDSTNGTNLYIHFDFTNMQCASCEVSLACNSLFKCSQCARKRNIH